MRRHESEEGTAERKLKLSDENLIYCTTYYSFEIVLLEVVQLAMYVASYKEIMLSCEFLLLSVFASTSCWFLFVGEFGNEGLPCMHA
jgi:hypothetical protein